MGKPLKDRLSRVLIVDDDAMTRELICTMFQREGIGYSAVTQGDEAVHAVEAENFDLVVMDIYLPIVDGLTACQLIRALPSPKSTLPILGITASADALRQRHGYEAGMDALLDKPFTLTELRTAIENCLDNLVR
jgi:CheY-like chemotaxis protein